MRYYLYFAQKDLSDLQEVKSYLEELGIVCGKMHNPSKKADPEYWRFFIKAQTHEEVNKIIWGWDPVKSRFFRVKG